MSNPTSNFGWQMPTPTDLVTDLPADFEVFGQAVDSTLADLKGGTTGQVLSKNSNTDMDFVWVTDAAGDITGVTAGTGISGGGTSGTVTITNSMATEITAKGDLIVGTGSATFDNLAAGANGSTIVADSSTSTGLRYQGSMAAARNAIINGGYDIWQRGTSFGSGAQYTADRWYKDGQTYSTVSRQTSGLTGFQYSCRTQRNAGQTGTADIGVVSTLETSNSLIFAGQTITVSFWAKAGANFSPTSSRLTVYVPSGTGTDQLRTFASAFTGEAAVINTTQVITTTWTRYSFTGSVGSSATQLAVYLAMAGTGTAGANDWFEIAGVQMELGSVATNFTRTGGTIQGELAAAMRYYYLWTSGQDKGTALGFYQSSTSYYLAVPFPVEMRIKPTVIAASGTSYYYALGAGGYDTFNSVTAWQGDSKSMGLSNTTEVSGTAGYAAILGGGSASTSIAFSAEL